jgi:hypothetical protein
MGVATWFLIYASEYWFHGLYNIMVWQSKFWRPNSSSCSVHHSHQPCTYPLLDPNILFRAVFSNTLNLHSLFTARIATCWWFELLRPVNIKVWDVTLCSLVQSYLSTKMHAVTSHKIVICSIYSYLFMGCRIWGSHTCGYEKFYVLGYNAI